MFHQAYLTVRHPSTYCTAPELSELPAPASRPQQLQLLNVALRNPVHCSLTFSNPNSPNEKSSDGDDARRRCVVPAPALRHAAAATQNMTRKYRTPTYKI